MSTLRANIGKGSVMAAIAAISWLGSAWCIGVNSMAAYGAPAGDRLTAIAEGATWLAAPVLLGALPAWFLARAGIARGLGPQHGRLTRWFIVAWIINSLALMGLWLILLWHSGAPPESPSVDLPVLILAMWCTAFTAYVPVLIALQARRREAAQPATLDTSERDSDDGGR